MWKPFRNVTKDKAPQAAILFDKFHAIRHLGEALDKVRKAEYAASAARVDASSRARCAFQPSEVQSAVAP